MNLYELASQDEAWGAFTLDDDDGSPLSAWPADPPAPMPLDAALDAAAREYGVDADVLRALGPGGSVDSIFDTAASLRSRLEAFDGDYAQALASYRQEEGHGGNALAAPAAAPLSPPALADAQVPAPGPAPSARTAGPEPRPRPARPPASTPVPGAPPSQAARPDQPPAPPDGRLGAADDPRSLLYRQAPAAQKPLVDAARSQPGSGTDTASFAPVRPEVHQALGNAWDAASPGERQRMQSMPGWQGQLARERAAQYAQADKGVLAASPTAALLDSRAENRAKAPPATGAAPRAGGNDRAQANTALPRAVPATVPQRSWGEAFSDTTKSVAQGILDVASFPGVAYSAATGDYDTRYLNAIRGTQEVLQDDKSPALQASAQARQQKLAAAEGWREKLAVGGWETLRNPTLLGDTLARSGPGMLAGGLLGRAAGGAVDAAGNAMLGRTIATGSEAAARSAVALKNAAPAMASGTAVGASAAQQGASVANDLYAELQKLPTSAFAAEPEFQQLAREHGQDKARDILAAAATTRALLVGTGASVLSMKLVPGGDAIEKMFLPSHLKGGAAREAVKSSSFLTQPLTRGMQGNLGTQALEIAVQGLKHGTTGSLSEGAEEASGAVAQGLELSRAGQDVKLSDMAGEAAGQAMAAGFAMDGAAGTRGAGAAPRVQNQPTRPNTPPASPQPPAPTMARGQTAPEVTTANGPAEPPLPSPAAPLGAALLPGYSEALQPGSRATWSNTTSATRKAQAEAEILRQAEALPAQDAAIGAATTPSPAAPSATPTMPMPASTDGNRSSTQQGANALPQGQVNSDTDQAETATQATATDLTANAPGTPTPAPTPSTLNAEADASAAATEAAPTTTQHGTARHTAAAQVPAPAPIEAQVQALDSGMLVVGGDQATILAHLQAGGVRGAEPFAGVTLVPVDQAALARRVLSRPPAAPAGPVGTQADRGSQRTSATATLPRARTAAQLAPTATQAPTAGSSIGGPSPVGASAPRTEVRHGSPTSAAASQPVPVLEMQRDGTLMVKGDPTQLQERLRQGGVERVLRREGGVVVGLDQVGKARQLLQQPPPRAKASAGPAPTGQQFSRSAPPSPDRPSRAKVLPSKPATVQSVRAAVARLTNSMGLLANGLGRVVVATSADIQAHWEPLVGEVDMGSQDTGLAQGFFDPNTDTVFLIADHIEAGQEMAVAAHELVHKHGKAVLGEARWKQLHKVIGSWANRPEGGLERQVYDEAAARVQASRPAGADETSYSSEELFPYAVQVAMELGVQPTARMPANSVQGWLARVRASLQAVLGKLTGNPLAFDGQDLVDLAFAVAQREGAEHTNARFHEGRQRTGLLFSRALNQYMREAATFGEARAAAKEFQGRPLTNALTGLQAHVSRNSLDKMLSSKAVEKSVSAQAQSFAVANLDKLYQAAAYGWSKSDRDANSNIKAIHRFFVPMALNGRLLIAKLTVKETVDENHANPLYTVETVDFNEKSPAAQWVDASAKADGIDLTSIRSAGDVLSLAQEVERRNARGDAAGDTTPRFSTRSNDQGPGLSLEQVQQLVQQALSGLRNPPPVDIVGRSEEAWIGAPEGVMGAALPEEGRIVIVASAHQNADAVAETLFHEMFHLGVRNVLPSRDYVQSMLDLAKRDRRVQQYAIEWKAKAPDAPHQLRVLRERGFTGTELTAQYEALAIEEGLAVVAEELRAQKLAGTRLGMRIRTLANWLASVADRMGMGRLAASIRAMSYNEAERFVMRAIDQAGAVGAETSHTGQTRFSTRSAQDPSAGLQTDDTNDGTQPIHSMRMETQRDGTLMVQGDPVQLQERLRQGGVERVLRREGGVLVGLDQVGKARQLLQQPPLGPTSTGSTLPSQSSLSSLSGQQFSRSAPPSPDRPSRARGLPSKPATVQSVRAAVAKLTNSMGLLANGLGRVVVATSADIQAHWEPLVGKVDMGSPDSGLAQGFYDPHSKTVFLIADHIEAGQEMAVAAHELVHKHGKAVLGEARWRQLHEVIGSWANRPEGSLERRVHDEAVARVQASRPAGADETSYSSEELFPYAVQVAMELGVQPTALMPANSVQGWLARVRASLKDVLGKLTGNPQAFDGQDLVDLAFGIAQLERSASAPPQNGLERPNGSAPSAPYLPIQMSRDAGKDGAGAAPEKGPLGSENNPRPVPLTDFKVRITTDNAPSNAITMLVDGEDVDFAGIEITDNGPILSIEKTVLKKSSKEHVRIDAHGVTEAMLKAVISYYIETKGAPPAGLPGSLADDNRINFQKEFDKHRESNHNGTADDWAQAAIRDISFGKARQKLGYGVFEIELLGSINVGDLKNVPKKINIIARQY